MKTSPRENIFPVFILLFVYNKNRSMFGTEMVYSERWLAKVFISSSVQKKNSCCKLAFIYTPEVKPIVVRLNKRG